MDYSSAPIWDNCPPTNALAKPKQSKQVNNADVIEVSYAKYRRAEFSGVFLLSPNSYPNISEGKQRVEVDCCWFGHRLKTRGIKILIDTKKGSAIVKRNYSGLVVANLAK
jgi:hypothetical protein